MSEQQAFWEQAEQVEIFAAREPDHRLLRLMEGFADPSKVHVLDLGCAGGRNAEPLARAGFRVTALDASLAMVTRTRNRLADLIGSDRVSVSQCRMDALRSLGDGAIDLVVALGVYQQAESEGEFARSIAESARVLHPGGRVLVANFAPGTGPLAAPPRHVPDTKIVYEGFRHGRACLLTASELDAAFLVHALHPVEPSQTVDKVVDGSRRVTVNALYARRDP